MCWSYCSRRIYNNTVRLLDPAVAVLRYPFPAVMFIPAGSVRMVWIGDDRVDPDNTAIPIDHD